ncbi:MAG: hypothetical protein PHV32_09610 [Eubacteriales bacterium]|nr:hypothetical protein [Eubacteriales bacterium]
MKEKILKLKSYKPIGIVLLVLSGLTILSNILQQAIYSQAPTILEVLSMLSTIPMGVALFLKAEKTRNIVFSIGLFVIAIVQMLLSVTQYHQISFIGILLAIGYAALGFVVINNYKAAKVGYIVFGILFSYSIFCSYFGGLITRYLLSTGSVVYSLTVLPVGLLDLLSLICIALVFLTYTDKKCADNTVTLNANVIDFKTLLNFIEEEHKAGKITDDEYNQKRAEIISKI